MFRRNHELTVKGSLGDAGFRILGETHFLENLQGLVIYQLETNALICRCTKNRNGGHRLSVRSEQTGRETLQVVDVNDAQVVEDSGRIRRLLWRWHDLDGIAQDIHRKCDLWVRSVSARGYATDHHPRAVKV
ncbi:MAG: hypothetical protein QNJ67_18220 [Kiloniellales bacterium]|nr:hypothetical protein [Kiloniellales bacterium]